MDTNLIGYAPGAENLSITDSNRSHIKAWLVSQGIDATRVESMRDATLYKAYAKPAYLRAILSRGDYNVNVAKPVAPRPLEAPAPVIYAPQEPAPRVAVAGDAPTQLAALIASIAGGAVDEARVIDLIHQHAPRPDERVIERLIIDRQGERIELPDDIRHEKFEETLACVMSNIPVMLVGPAGAGKTTLGKQISVALGLSFSHTGAVSSRYELSGFVDAHGNYQRTAFRDAFEHGGVFLFDEIDGSDSGALLWCNTAIANGECAFPDGSIHRHADFRLIAAANTFGRGADRVYVGRNQLDGASLDRFAVIDFDYDEKMERAIFGDNDWTLRVQKIRRAIVELKLRHVVSPRATDYGKRLLQAGITQDRVEQMAIFKGLKADDIAKINNAI